MIVGVKYEINGEGLLNVILTAVVVILNMKRGNKFHFDRTIIARKIFSLVSTEMYLG
jgi:hypothetical protein